MRAERLSSPEGLEGGGITGGTDEEGSSALLSKEDLLKQARFIFLSFGMMIPLLFEH